MWCDKDGVPSTWFLDVRWRKGPGGLVGKHGIPVQVVSVPCQPP